jgi:hypothetical protein
LIAEWAVHLEAQLVVAAPDLSQEHQVQTFLIVEDLTARMLRKLT